MSEFSKHDFKEWFQLSLKMNCSIYKAIHYSNFWSTDSDKISRAYKAFCRHYELEDGSEE